MIVVAFLTRMPIVGLMEATTRHSDTCRKAFRNYDLTCPRCRELASGAPARNGWGSVRRQQEQMQCVSIRNHFAPGGPHAMGLCGPVCTFGDW